MKRITATAFAMLALGGIIAIAPIATAAPTEQDAAKLEAEVGLTTEQQSKVNASLDEMKSKRREIKVDSSLSRDEQRAKTKVVNGEYLGRVPCAGGFYDRR